MAQIESWFAQDLTNPVKVHYIDGNVFSQDNDGNLVGVRVFADGEPATLSGTVAANVIRADGGTVAVSGTLSGNAVSVVLPAAAYAIPGIISIIIKLTDGETITTLCAAVANVYQSSTDTIIDPGTIIPSIQTLIDTVENVETQVEEVIESIPEDYTNLSNDVEQLKSAIDDMRTATPADLGKALIAKEVESGKVTEWEFGEAGGGISATAANLLMTILDEGVYGSDQSANIELLRKALLDIEPVSISAVLDSTPYVGLYYSDLKFIVTATFDDASTLVVDDYRITTPGQVTSGSNTVTVRFRFTTCETTFTASTATTYSITNTLSHVDTDNNDYLILAGERYEAELTVEEGYYLSSCTVTMGGVDITSTAYNNGYIVIAEVTGNVAITVVAEQIQILDPLVQTLENYSVTIAYSDDGQTQIGRINYKGNIHVSEYPAKSNCTINYKLTNKSDTDIEFGSAYIGGISGLMASQTTDTQGKVFYAVEIKNTTGNLAPGASLEGSVSILANYQIAFLFNKDFDNSIELELSGNFVPETFADYAEVPLESLSRYGSYRRVTYMTKDDVNLGNPNFWKLLVSSSLSNGSYNAIFKRPGTSLMDLRIGMVASDTDTTAYNSVGFTYSIVPNIWYLAGTLVVSATYPNAIMDEGQNSGRLLLKEVSVNG